MTKDTGKDKQDSKVVPISKATVGRATGGSRTRGKSSPRHQGLTDKQEAFCHAVMSGQCFSDAYRSCYNAAGMTAASIHVEASKLAASPKVSIRIESLQRDMEAQRRMQGAARGDAVLKQLTDIAMDLDIQDGARVRALELLGKSVGLWIDKVETEDVTAERSASDIREAIEAKLSRYQ